MCVFAYKGKPYPTQEQNAIDVVMQFALNKLGFKIDNIVLFGWSIGGYTATWAAMNYPEVKGVVCFEGLCCLILLLMKRRF